MLKLVTGLALALGAAAMPRRLQSLNNKGVSGCSNAKPCGLCQGDCDSDKQCSSGLACFQRNGMQAIPGCAPGGKSDVRGFDFCYASSSTNANLIHHNIVNLGFNGCTTSKPCGLCEGDCDNDKQCMAGLQCFQRNAQQPVPGCQMNAHNNIKSLDFCITPTQGSTNHLIRHNLVDKGWSGCTNSRPCGVCQGDCDSDKQCKGGLQCFQRNAQQPVPGCHMNAQNNIKSADFCITPTQGQSNHLNRHNLDNKGWSGCSKTHPCRLCEGDCDTDADCFGGLKCFERNDRRPVPGCRMNGKANVKSLDFCITPTQGHTNGLKRHNLVNKGVSGCKTTHQCAQCQGDCDRDSDCMAGLKCFQRNDKRPVPGCQMNAKNNVRAYDFCITETQGSTNGLSHHNLVNKGGNGCSQKKKCQLCQGDCDRDSDCVTGLMCFQRNDMRPVPGCQMNAKNNKRAYDFCITQAQGNNNGLLRHNLQTKGVNGCTSLKPCGLCQGDCDRDTDCNKGLRCFQRANLNPVPGCIGQGVRSFDYCWAGH